MAGHLLALIVGEALAHRGGDRIQLGGEARKRRGGRGVIRLGQQHQTASPLDQYAHLQGVTDLSSVHWW